MLKEYNKKNNFYILTKVEINLKVKSKTLFNFKVQVSV